MSMGTLATADFGFPLPALRMSTAAVEGVNAAPSR
jgi:hypothetical protein